MNKDYHYFVCRKCNKLTPHTSIEDEKKALFSCDECDNLYERIRLL